MPLCLPLTTIAPLSAQGGDEEQIRIVRAKSNQAIAERDLATLESTLVEDFQATISSGKVVSSAAEMVELFAKAIEDPRLIGYVRTPDRIEVSQGGTFAAESGEWTGRWTMEDGEKVVRGTYLAQWRKGEGEWRNRAELFVALSCEGSASCGSLP